MSADDRTRSVVSTPGDAIQILTQDRDVWKKRALEAESRIKTQDEMIFALNEALTDARKALG